MLPSLRNLRQKDYHEFEASLGYTVSPNLAWAAECNSSSEKSKMKNQNKIYDYG